MDAIRQNAKNPIVTGVAGLLVGLILGLFVLGWWLWPVEWTNGSPSTLGMEWKTEYLRMAVSEFSLNRNTGQAMQRFAELGEDGQKALDNLVNNPEGISAMALSDFQTAIGVPAVTTPSIQGTNVSGLLPTVEASYQETKSEKKSSLSVLFAALCVLLLVAGAFVAYMLLVRKKSTSSEEFGLPQQVNEPRRRGGYTDYATTDEEPPISQFMASYKLGDDLFDDSFSIDSASGEFLGECGVGISETIGVGDHKKVTAFEVWLFDKNDIQTITKVLMSAHAYNDPSTRQRLQAKGEPVLLEPGIETVLETQTLQLVARVSDASYGNGAMPTESYFDHLLLELAVWTKPS